MMRFGICTGFRQTDGGFAVPNLDFIQTMGFDYLELPLNAITALSEQDFEALTLYLRGISLPITACNCYMDSSIALTGEQADPAQYGAYIQKAVQRAAVLGVQKLVLGSGGSRNVPGGFPMQQAQAQLLQAIACMLQAMAPYSMELELEHLNRGESNILTSFAQTTDLVLQQGIATLKSILDLYHFQLGNEPLALITQRIGAVGHIHYARTLGRSFPTIGDMGQESIVLKQIQEAGYSGTLSMECAFAQMAEKPVAYVAVMDAFRKIFA